MGLATKMIRFMEYTLGQEGQESLVLRLECFYYFGSNDTDDPTEFEIRAAYKPDGSEYDVSKLQDSDLYNEIYEKFREEFDSELNWRDLSGPFYEGAD